MGGGLGISRITSLRFIGEGSSLLYYYCYYYYYYYYEKMDYYK